MIPKDGYRFSEKIMLQSFKIPIRLMALCQSGLSFVLFAEWLDRREQKGV
jgi:hypothetical protein